MNTIYFYMYLSIVILATLGFTFLRCVHGVKEFDMFFYPNPNNNIVENQVYLLSHILVNFLIGYLFGFEVFVGMLVKISIFEIYLYMVEKCDVFKTSKFHHLAIIIIISILSYTAGCLAKLYDN